MPRQPQWRLPGPVTDGFFSGGRVVLDAALEDLNAWQPIVRTRNQNIQHAVIAAAEDPQQAISKLDAWINLYRPLPIQNLPAQWPPSYSGDKAALAIAWIYDQLKPLLSEEIKVRWRNKCVDALDSLRQVWDRTRYTGWNSVLGNRAGIGPFACALAACPDDTSPRSVELWNWTIARHLEVLEIFEVGLDGGAYWEGPTYFGQSGKLIYQLCSFSDHALGTKLLERPWLKDTLRMVDYLVEPDYSWVAWGDPHTQTVSVTPDPGSASFEAYVATACATNDPIAIRRLTRNGPIDPHALPLFPWAHRVPSGEIGPIPALPTHREFRGAGLLSWRDGWNGEQTKMVTIWTSPDKPSHQFPCMHFEIWHRGLLVGGSGAYSQGALGVQAAMHRRFTGTNGLSIYDPEDRSNQYTWRAMRSKNNYENVPWVNDGSYKRTGTGFRTKPLTRREWEEREEEYRAGVVLRTEHNENFKHVAIDGSALYRSYPNAPEWSGRTNRVVPNGYVRHYVWVQDQVLLVIDLLLMTKPMAIAFRLNTRETPIALGERLWKIQRVERTEWQYGVPRHLVNVDSNGHYINNGHLWVEALVSEADESAVVGVCSDESRWGIVASIGGLHNLRGNTQDAYNGLPGVQPTDPRRGPAEACGSMLEVYYPPTFAAKVLVHAISFGEHRPCLLNGNAVSIPSLGCTIEITRDGAVQFTETNS